jgi:hypothetical protein
MPPATPQLDVQCKRRIAIPFLPEFVSPTAGTGIKAHQDLAVLFVQWISWPVSFIYTRFSMTDNIGSCRQRHGTETQHFCTDGAEWTASLSPFILKASATRYIANLSRVRNTSAFMVWTRRLQRRVLLYADKQVLQRHVPCSRPTLPNRSLKWIT